MQNLICILMEIHKAFWKELVLQLVGVCILLHIWCIIVLTCPCFPFCIAFLLHMFSYLASWNIPCIHENFSFSYAATFVLLPLNYLVNNSGISKNPLAECSLHVLLILINYHRSIMSDESMTDKSDDSATSESVSKVHVLPSGNTFSKALANARDVECEIFFFFIIFLSRANPMCMSKLYTILCVCLNIIFSSFDWSWPLRCWGKCPPCWSTCSDTICFAIWYSWHVSCIFLSFFFTVTCFSFDRDVSYIKFLIH